MGHTAKPWNLSHAQYSDLDGRPFAFARAHFFISPGRMPTEAYPMPVYRDAKLSQMFDGPVIADEGGIFPLVFLDRRYGFYTNRLSTEAGEPISGIDATAVIGI